MGQYSKSSSAARFSNGDRVILVPTSFDDVKNPETYCVRDEDYQFVCGIITSPYTMTRLTPNPRYNVEWINYVPRTSRPRTSTYYRQPAPGMELRKLWPCHRQPKYLQPKTFNVGQRVRDSNGKRGKVMKVNATKTLKGSYKSDGKTWNGSKSMSWYSVRWSTGQTEDLIHENF